MIALLLVTAAIAHILPMALPAWFGGKAVTWEYICYGFEATVLWLAVAAGIRSKWYRWGGWAVCFYGVFESSQRWGCRLLLPLERPLNLPEGVHVCDAAGIPTTAFSPVAIALVAAVVAAAHNKHV